VVLDPSSYTIVNGDLFPAVKRSEYEASHLTPSSARCRKLRELPERPLHDFLALCSGTGTIYIYLAVIRSIVTGKELKFSIFLLFLFHEGLLILNVIKQAH
jgi:hypothetical protein